MSIPQIEVSADRESLTLTFPSEPPFVIRYDAKQADDLIKGLGMARAMMQPEVPMNYALGQRVACIPDPRYATEPEAMKSDSMLHLRHPGLGWLSFLLPKAEAAKLAGFLQAQASQDIGPSGKIVN